MPPAPVALPLFAFVVYAAVSLIMVNEAVRPVIPASLAGKVQLGDLIFPLAVTPWIVAGFPGLRRVAGAAAVPAAIWATANAVTSTVAVSPGAAWRETAAFAYLGIVLVWGAAVLAAPASLRFFARWWVAAVALVVLLGLAGWLVAMLLGRPNFLVELRVKFPLLQDVMRIRSTVTTSRLLITLMIVALPAVFLLRREGMPGERRGSGWLLAAMPVCAVFTYARGLVEFLTLLGLLALFPWRGRRRALAAALVGVYVVATLVVMVWSTWRVIGHDVLWRADRSRIISEQTYGTMPDTGIQILDLHVEWAHDYYFILKRMAWRAFLERPLTGWGPDSWPAIRAWARESGLAPVGVRFGSAHNDALAAAAEMGVIGLAAFAAFWILVFRAMRPGGAGGFAGTLARHQRLATVAVLMTSLHLDVMRFRFLWITMALGIAAAVSARQEAAT